MNTTKSLERTQVVTQEDRTERGDHLTDDALLQKLVMRLVSRALSLHPGYVLLPGGRTQAYAEHKPNRRAS